MVPPGAITFLQVKSELVAAGQCQLTESVVAEPVVAACVPKSGFIFCPRTVEEVGSVDVLLDQQRRAVACKTTFVLTKLLANRCKC